MTLIYRRTRIPALCIFGLWLLLFALPQPSQAAPSQKQEIYQLLEMHRYPQAEQFASAYLAANPGDCGVNAMLGLALRGQQKLEPAYKAFRSAMNRCPKSLAAAEGAAETAFLLNRPEAEGLLVKVLALRPGDETSYAMLGAIDVRSGNCAGAVENYAKAPNSINQNAAALRQYGGCLLAVDKAAEAVPVLTQLLSLKDDSANRLALAQAQSKAGDSKSALATLQPLLDAGANDSRALLLAAQLSEANENTPQAVACLRKAIEVDPHNVDAYLFFSELSFNHGSFKIGIDFLNLGIGQLPKEARLYLARGVLEVQTSQTEKALLDFEEAHRLDPKLSFARDAQGMLFSQKHDSAAALAIFEQQSKLHPNDALVQYLYAEALSEAGESRNTLEKALEAATRAVKLEPGYQAARDLLCVLLLRHNDLNAVIEQAEEALRRDPYDEAALYQELLAESKLKHAERTQALVKRLQVVKAHNQQAKTKYLLQEGQSSSSASE